MTLGYDLNKQRRHVIEHRERRANARIALQHYYQVNHGLDKAIVMHVQPWETDEHGNLSRQIYQVEQ